MAGEPKAFYNWLSTFLKDRGLRFSKSGFKGGSDFGKHRIDERTGYWENPQYSGSKPPRWLFQIDLTDGEPSARLPGGMAEIGIGGSNTAQGGNAALAVRILPIIKLGDGEFVSADVFEVNALFLFHGPLKAGKSNDSFSFDVTTGTLKRVGRPEDYLFAALVGLRDRDDQLMLPVGGVERPLRYGEVLDALRAAITVRTKGGAAAPIAVYDLSAAAGLNALKHDAGLAWEQAGPAPVDLPPAAAAAADEEAADDQGPDLHSLEIAENPDLLGIDPAVYRQINALLKSGKQHLMLYGPPGTGKTSLARWIATSLAGSDWTLITGSSDWSSQDIIGGYQPIGGGEVDFVPGVLLRAFDQPLIIDELNRCDIDKVIGPLFTVLSGQQTTLPYRVKLSDKDSPAYVILPEPKPAAAAHEFAPGPQWRLIATINSIDKASLYQMSYALMRRFGWVYVDAPRDLRGFLRDYLAALDPQWQPPAADAPAPLAAMWQAINRVRVIGPAPIIDAIMAIRTMHPGLPLFGPANDEMRQAALDVLDMVMLPMLDGITHQDAEIIAEAMIEAFAFDAGEAEQLRARLATAAI